MRKESLLRRDLHLPALKCGNDSPSSDLLIDYSHDDVRRPERFFPGWYLSCTKRCMYAVCSSAPSDGSKYLSYVLNKKYDC